MTVCEIITEIKAKEEEEKKVLEEIKRKREIRIRVYNHNMKNQSKFVFI